MYYLVCIMQSHKMTKLDKIIFYLRPEERKILMEKLQKDESGERKKYYRSNMSFFFSISLIIYLKLLDNMFQTIY